MFSNKFYLQRSVSELNDQVFVFLFKYKSVNYQSRQIFSLNIKLKLSIELTHLQKEKKTK